MRLSNSSMTRHMVVDIQYINMPSQQKRIIWMLMVKTLCDLKSEISALFFIVTVRSSLLFQWRYREERQFCLLVGTTRAVLIFSCSFECATHTPGFCSGSFMKVSWSLLRSSSDSSQNQINIYFLYWWKCIVKIFVVCRLLIFSFLLVSKPVSFWR